MKIANLIATVLTGALTRKLPEWLSGVYRIAGPVAFIALCLSTATQAAGSMDMVYEVRADNDLVYVANPDHDSVTVVDAVSAARITEIRVGDEPRRVALDGRGFLWVTNKADSSISIISTSSLSVIDTLTLAPASSPHGVVIDTSRNHAYVVLQALGTLNKFDTISGALISSATLGSNAREVSIDNEGLRLYLPRFITRPVNGESGRVPENGSGEVLVLNARDLSVDSTISVAFNRARLGFDSNISARGVPNYLRAMAISPGGREARLPAKIDNIHRGSLRDGQARRFNLGTRGILATINLETGREVLSRRIEFTNNSQPTAAAYTPDGEYVFVVHEASRAMEVINAQTGVTRHQLTLGFAPTGLAMAADGTRVFVHNWLDRTLSVLDSSRLVQGEAPQLINTVNLIEREALDADVLLGKRLFHDSADPRLSGQRYMSCSACHDEGGHDGRVWDFADVGEGLRNTPDLRGRGNMDNGNLHWTANFDEVQDFEGVIRFFAGTGLLTDEQFDATSDPMNPAAMKTGLSLELDALAAYVGSFDDYGRSPYRLADDQLSDAGLRGRAVFNMAGCASCHYGEHFSDSALGGSHNIGTVDADTGLRLGQPLLNGGLDTPPLKGLWRTAPYLHDGSANTIRDAVLAHTQAVPVNPGTLSDAELDDLTAYLLQIDSLEPAHERPPSDDPPTPDSFSTQAAILIDGNLNDWPAESLLVHDAQDAIGGENNQLDYETVWMANDTTSLFLRYRNHSPYAARLTWGYGLAIDVDGTSSGYRPPGNRVPVGVDYLVEEQSVYRYTGNGSSWSWVWVAPASIVFSERDAELAVRRSVLGNPDTFRFFLYADNTAIGGTAIDFIPDSVTNTGALSDSRYFTYTFAGDVSEPPQPPADSHEPVYSNPVTALQIDGSLTDWQSLDFYPSDGADVANATNGIDFLRAATAHDQDHLYFGWTNSGATSVTWGNAIYVDTDLNAASGFRGFQDDAPIGIDYLIEADAVYRYVGNGNSWQWQWAGQTEPVVAGNVLELRVPSDLLGNPQTMDLFFYGDSSAIGGSGLDFYPDEAADISAAAVRRHFRYSRNPASDS